MNSIHYIDRNSGQVATEEVFGESAIRFLYGNSWLSKILGRISLHGLAKWPPVSRFYGFLQNLPSSKARVMPFIKRFGMDASEFVEAPENFATFNDFFIRKLKPSTRPLAMGAVMPADARYTFVPEIGLQDVLSVKNRPFCLRSLLQDDSLAQKYAGGCCVLARLCPTDCHRFYFPFDCIASKAKAIDGKLFSVNPIATQANPWIWGENRRMLTMLSSKEFGEVAFLEVGATNVGTIIQTYTPDTLQQKGAEKGYFAFGGSALIMLFEKGRIQLADDLTAFAKSGLEILCLIGQPLGR